MNERPEGIIITLSREMFHEKGYRNWYKNFMDAMEMFPMHWIYYFRTSGRPKYEVPWLYICAGNKIRFRCNLILTEGPGEKTFPDDGNRITTLYGKGWLICCGPVVIAPRPMIEMKGFQGFRYTEKLF